MGKVEQLPDLMQVEREASDWIARLGASDVSAADRERFAQWLEAHPYHARTYHGLRATWRRFERAGPVLASIPELVGAEHGGHRRRYVFPATIAASLLLAVASLWWWLNAAAPSMSAQLQTAVGKQASLPLPDGSAVMLNTNSAASVTYTSTQRMVQLERGEAHFEVAHDLSRPFWVTVGNTWIRAVGTEFDVRIEPHGVAVLVTEGQVKVAPARTGRRPSDQALTDAAYSLLDVGQRIEYRGQEAQLRRMTAQEWRRSQGWRTGKLEFDDQALDEVVAELDRYTDARLIIDDERLRGVRFGGTFKASDEGVQTVLGLLQQGWGVELRRESPNRVYLSRADDWSPRP